jgi:hypothetical protein
MAEVPEHLALARRVAGFALPGSSNGTESLSVPEELWPSFKSAVKAQRLTGLAVAGAEDGWLRLSEAQEEDLLADHRDAMVWALMIERSLVSLASAFEEAGIGFVVLKGPTFAHTVYPDPSWRPFSDLDLLVRTQDWSRACSVLESRGFRRDLPEPRAGFDERFGKAATHTGKDGLQVDLHRTLVLGPFGLWLDPSELFGRTVAFALAGRTLRRLDDTALLLHACMHASLGWNPPMLLSLRDVAEVAGRGEVDWPGAVHLAQKWRLAAVVRHAFGAAERLVGAEAPEGAQELLRLRPRRREWRALDAYTTDRRARGGMALTTLWAIRGIGSKAAYVRGLLFPDRKFLAARMRGPGRASYRGRWKVAFRWLHARRRGIQR